jgi:hypothetical protein
MPGYELFNDTSECKFCPFGYYSIKQGKKCEKCTSEKICEGYFLTTIEGYWNYVNLESGEVSVSRKIFFIFY